MPWRWWVQLWAMFSEDSSSTFTLMPHLFTLTGMMALQCYYQSALQQSLDDCVELNTTTVDIVEKAVGVNCNPILKRVYDIVVVRFF